MRPIDATRLHFSFTGALVFGCLVCLWLIATTQTAKLEPARSLLTPQRSALRLTPARTFNIVIFADLHFGEEENGWGIDQDLKSLKVMRTVLDAEAPDFVVINGDLITGENTFRENSTGYVDQIVQPLVGRNMPWASTYGNHDSKFNLSREALYIKESSYELSHTTRMNTSLPGITNYYLLLYDYAIPGSPQPVAILWFFDSLGGASYQHEPANEDVIPNWVGAETVQWFRDSQQALQTSHGVLPSLAFVHIPPHVFLDAQDGDLNPSRFPGVDDDIPVAIEGEGAEDEDFVRALLDAAGLHSIHVGHDHGNAWCSTWPNNTTAPFLCFSKHSAYGGYGTWNRGARVVQLSFGMAPADFQVETWVRMENGDIVTRVMLNETYGEDEYSTYNGE